MSTYDGSPDPYRSPAYFGDREESADAPHHRPGGLTAICVIAIIFGSLGLLIALFALGAMLAGDALQNAFSPRTPAGMEDDEMLELQEEMQQDLEAIAEQHVIPTSVILMGRFLFAIGLLVGAVKVLKLRPGARTLLMNIFLAAIIFELVRFGVELYVQMQTMPVLERYMDRMMEIAAEDAPPGAADPQQMSQMVMTITKVVSIGGLVLFLLIKVIFYGIGASYLSKQKMKALFARSEAMQSSFGSGPPTI